MLESQPLTCWLRRVSGLLFKTVLGTTVEEASSINECTGLDSDTGMQVSVLVAGDCEGPRELRPTQGTLAVNAGVARPRKEGFGD